MPDYKGVLKSAGQRGSALKGQVKSRIGRGEDTTARYENHTSAPLASLRDPASFAPPPKRNPNAIIAAPSPTGSSPSTGPPIPSRTGTFSEPEQQEPAPPPKPFRLDTTGLSTTHLPPPPGRKDSASIRSPPPVPPSNNNRPGPPSLPPRLPPRSSNPASPITGTPSPPPPYSSPALSGPALPTRHKSPVTPAQPSPTASSPYLNQSAISRLGAAGVSVPGLGIGRGNTTTTSTATSDGRGGYGTAPTLEDVRAAANAVNAADEFRRKHGEQVGAGVKAFGGLQGRFGEDGHGSGGHGSGIGSGSGIAGNFGNLAAVAGKKKPPPPPPPKKKPGLLDGGRGKDGQEYDEPPPIPMATRPQF